MKKGRCMAHSLAILMILASVLQAGNNAQTTYTTLANGMKLVLKENHSSPMITSVVFVNAGARYEDESTNGLTHFLEHLLFDGTASRNRIQLNETIDEYGGYINAFTRKDLTAYLVLMPKEYIDIGLDIQSDQLFNSTLPEAELPKERKIVIEEIRKDNDVPDNLAEYFYDQTVFKGTPYSRSVLGTPDHISSIPREKILEYYHKYYVPNNMIALIIGDFDTDQMIKLYERYFGKAPKGKLPQIEQVNFAIPEGHQIAETTLPTKSFYIDLAFPAPRFSDPDYYPFTMLVDYLGSGETSPMTKNLQEKGLVSTISASLETQKDFSLLRISAQTDSREHAEAAIWELERILSDPDLLTLSYETFHGLIVSRNTQELYLREKLHYYGFTVAPMMVTTGYKFVETLVDSLEKVTPLQIHQVAGKYFSNFRYIGTLVTPEEQKQSQITTVSQSDLRKVTFDNGLTVIIKQNPDSRVFAVNIFGKNRAAMEPAGQDGITDLLNRLLEKGTEKYNKQILSERLANIGAQLTLTDNPYIPYDDFYTSRQYSFIKFETIDEYADEGLDLLAEMVIHPSLDSVEIANAKREMLAALGMASASTSQTCANSFYRLMFGENHPFVKVPLGSQRTVMTISRDNLVEHHKKFYAPNNMIMAVCTNRPTDWVLGKLKETFGQMPQVTLENIQIAPPANPSGVVSANTPMKKEQVYICLGRPTVGIKHPDYPALQVATEILSSRLGLQLREVEGLAYSVGAGVSSAPEFGWFTVTMGTGKANYQAAHDGILREIAKMQNEPVNETELRTAQNSIWGTSLSRQLSRINQAYYLTLYEFLGMPLEYRETFIDKIRAVNAADVLNAAKTYFPSDNYYLATAGLE